MHSSNRPSCQPSHKIPRAHRWLAVFLLGLALACRSGLALASFTNGHGDLIDVVTKLSDNSQVTVWRIDQPNTGQPASDYPQIQFQPGDQFRILAGGCDQTGGHGRTWKLYVNPQGDNTDHLYHGLIYVAEARPPGAPEPTPPVAGMGAFSRLSQFGVGDGLGHGDPATHYIPAPLPDHRDTAKQPIILQLGFEDDGYGDNGYWGRDPGNNDQCVNVPAAFLIITIGHHGAIAPNPELYWGIRPEDFDCQAGWAFTNGDTPTLSYASFQTAFQITWAGKYLNLFNEILFQAGKGMASGGNCEGMSLLALAGEDQFVVGDLKESFWDNYRYQMFSQTPENIQFDINVAHWQQLSGYFIHNWLFSIESDASTIISHIEHDLATGNGGSDYTYGLLSLKHGGSGHVVVPLAVTHSGDHTYIEVYNPNRPCPGIPHTANEPKIDIVGENWSYDMGSDGIWTGSNGALGLLNNGMGYVPYHGPDDGWTDQVTSLSGLVEVIFGSAVSVDQVTDSRGRKLIVDGKVDKSPQGLGRMVFQLPDYAPAERPKRPRSGNPAKVLKVAREPEGSAAQKAMLAQYDREYGEDYALSRRVYIVRAEDLSDVTFSLSSRTAGKPVRALINQGNSFLEVNASAGAGTDRIHPALTVHSVADVARGGVTLSSADARALKVSFTHGLYDEAAKTETLQQSGEIAFTKAAKASIADGALHLATAETPSDIVVNRRMFTADGNARTSELRHVTTETIVAPPAAPKP